MEVEQPIVGVPRFFESIIRWYDGAQAKYQAALESHFRGTIRSVPTNGPNGAGIPTFG